MGNIIAAIAVLGALGALFGLILSVASKIFEVKKDPREEAILSHLAGANCGGWPATLLSPLALPQAPTMLPPSLRSWAWLLPPVSVR